MYWKRYEFFNKAQLEPPPFQRNFMPPTRGTKVHPYSNRHKVLRRVRERDDTEWSHESNRLAPVVTFYAEFYVREKSAGNQRRKGRDMQPPSAQCDNDCKVRLKYHLSVVIT